MRHILQEIILQVKKVYYILTHYIQMNYMLKASVILL